MHLQLMIVVFPCIFTMEWQKIDTIMSFLKSWGVQSNVWYRWSRTS
jgi:hypothetical protein